MHPVKFFKDFFFSYRISIWLFLWFCFLCYNFVFFNFLAYFFFHCNAVTILALRSLLILTVGSTWGWCLLIDFSLQSRSLFPVSRCLVIFDCVPDFMIDTLKVLLVLLHSYGEYFLFLFSWGLKLQIPVTSVIVHSRHFCFVLLALIRLLKVCSIDNVVQGLSKNLNRVYIQNLVVFLGLLSSVSSISGCSTVLWFFKLLRLDSPQGFWHLPPTLGLSS